MSKLIKSIEEDPAAPGGTARLVIELADGSRLVVEAKGDYYTPDLSHHCVVAPPAPPSTTQDTDVLFLDLGPAEGPAATERQVGFIRKLCEEREIEAPLDPQAISIYALTVPQASTLIDRLLALPKPTIKAPEGTSKVAPGYYAIDHTDGETCFYRVQRAKEGEHAGKTFVMRQSGDNFVRIPKTEVVEALEAILKDPVKAGVRYGREIGRCCKCNRTLTDEASRKAGIGPECNKSSWNA